MTRPENHVSGWLVLLVFALLGGFIWYKATDGGSATATSVVSARTVATPSSIPSGHQADIERWHYVQEPDAMSNGKTYGAAIRSANTVSFDFPYDGAQHATLILRTHPRYGKQVILTIERGQFLCPSYEGCTVLVRFDDGKAARFAAGGADDNSTTALFIRNYSQFVARMEKAKRVRISVNVYREGAPVFDFDVHDFDASKYRPAISGTKNAR